MSYQALARKYRPQSFRDIIGQETAVRTLQNAIEQDRIHHAFLFSGVRGVGKTTSARIVAKALNCIKGPTTEPCNVCTMCTEITEGIDMDVREIDAATYTGVDNIRELREATQFQPARDRYRIFIIDEAHMLSTGAWNALLKILEEPPPHVVFMFATTEVQKVPSTILSRVQKFALRKITLDELIGQLEKIAKSEGITADRAALEIIARRGEGSVRDALSLLDQIIAFGGRKIGAIEVSTVLGLSDTTFFARVIGLMADGDHAGILQAVEEAAETGRDFKMLYRDLLNFVRNLLLLAGGANEAALAVTPEDLATIRSVSGRFTYTELLRIANLLLRDDETVNRAEHQRLAVEIALLKATTFPRLRDVEQLLAGSPTASATSPAPRPAAPKQSAAGGGGATQKREAPITQRSSAPPSTLDSRPSTPEVPPTLDPRPSTLDIQDFVDRLQKTRPLLAGYLSGAKSIRKDGSRVVLLFDDEHFAQPLIDAKQTLQEIAADVYGAPSQIIIETAGQKPQGSRRADEKQSTLLDDPVVKAFAKHLGGEVVEPRKR
ncbi:MAG: DNA polymerase III subunit gamma/tau [Thermoanaerobaculia bacterium]|nr:DNA polymerase III subunit gamma/tau [Thermoanaerobaculia bacterium]